MKDNLCIETALECPTGYYGNRNTMICGPGVFCTYRNNVNQECADECPEGTVKDVLQKTCNESCEDGYYASQVLASDVFETCLRCPAECLLCSGPDPEDCTTCHTGYAFHSHSDSS